MSRRKPLPKTGDGAALFAEALKDVRPLRGRRSTATPPVAAPKPTPPIASRPGIAPHRPPPSPKALPELKPGIRAHPDRATAERLRRGRMAVEATLDLHGMTLAKAEPALHAFLARAQAQGLKLVLVVTGKGTRVDRDTGRIAEGAIRREFPHWLNQAKNRGRIVAFRAAHQKHGGGGAFYVLLRRER